MVSGYLYHCPLLAFIPPLFMRLMDTRADAAMGAPAPMEPLRQDAA